MKIKVRMSFIIFYDFLTNFYINFLNLNSKFPFRNIAKIKFPSRNDCIDIEIVQYYILAIFRSKKMKF